MEQQGNENVTSALMSYIQDNDDGNNGALAAELMLRYAGNMTDTAVASATDGAIPMTPFTANSVLARHKFASAQLLKLYHLTYALQVKLLTPVKDKDVEKKYYFDGDSLALYSDLEVERSGRADAIKEGKVDKNDLNYIRSFYGDQLTSILPKVVHMVYIQFTTKNNCSYNPNEVRPVLADSAFIQQGLADVQRYIETEQKVFASGEKAQRDFLFHAWFHYAKASGKSAQKIGPFFAKLLTSTMSRLAKTIVKIRKDGEKVFDGKELATIREIYTKYMHGHTSIDAMSCDALYGKFMQKFTQEGLSNQVHAVEDLRTLALLSALDCDKYLVHLETLDNWTHLSVPSETSVRKAFSTVTAEEFAEAITRIGENAQVISSNGEDVYYTVASERLNLAIFKAIGAYNQFTSSEKVSRKKLSVELEKCIISGEMFREKLYKINDVKTTSTSERSKKQREESSLVLSTEAYEAIDDDRLREAFRHHHSDTECGVVQKGTMFLSALSKLHDNEQGKNTVVIAEGDQTEIQQYINNVSFVVSVYAGLNSKPEKEATVAKPLVKKPASAAASLSSPKAGAKTAPAAAPVRKLGLGVKKPAAEVEAPKEAPKVSLLSKIGKKAAPAPVVEEVAAEEVAEEATEEVEAPKPLASKLKGAGSKLSALSALKKGSPKPEAKEPEVEEETVHVRAASPARASTSSPKATAKGETSGKPASKLLGGLAAKAKAAKEAREAK